MSIEELRAKVPAASETGPNQDAIDVIDAVSDYIGFDRYSDDRTITQAVANAASIVAAVNIAKRLCTDEGVEAVKKAIRAEITVNAVAAEAIALAAIRAILGEQP